MCLDLLDCLEREPEFFSRVITGDESWILECDPETKRQSRDWHTANSPRPHKARLSKSKIKPMLFFLTVRGSSTRNLCHQDKLSIKLFIGKSLKTHEKGGTCATRHCSTWMLHHDNAPQSPSMNFWQKKAFLWFLSPPIRRISVPVTSFYSPGSKTT